MLATQSRTLLQFSEAERPLGERLLKLAAETDHIEGYSEPHAVELARLAEKLGERLGLRGLDLSALKFAALAHDLGERTMKRDYLLRAGGLTWEEQLDLWRHPIIGEQAAVDLKLPRLAQLLIRWHHENWNGLGYPDGLAGTEIPLGARILRVVDIYGALCADRPQRGRQAAEQVEQFIADQAGLETDPAVVKEFLALLAEERAALAPVFTTPEPDQREVAELAEPAYDPVHDETAEKSAAFVWPVQPVTEATAASAPLAQPVEPIAAADLDTNEVATEVEVETISASTSVTATDSSAEAVALPEGESAEPEVTVLPTAPLAETPSATEAPATEAPATEAEAAESVAVPPSTTEEPHTADRSPLPASATAPLEVEVPDRLPEVKLQIVALHDAVEHFWPVAQWIYEQWWATPDNSVQIVSDLLKEHLASTPLPATLVAVMDGQPVGSISLVEQAVADRTDLTPCLTALFVLPEHRHRGVATQLLNAAFTQAKAQGAERVFFAVPEQEDFFARRGWQVHEPALGAQALVVLSKQ